MSNQVSTPAPSRKSWQQDRQYCLMIFELARQIIGICQIGTLKTVSLEQLIKTLTKTNVLEAQRTIQVEYSEPKSELKKFRSRNVPCRLIVAICLMIFTTLFSAAGCIIVERHFPIGDSVSCVVDYLITIVCTTSAFLVIAQLWRKRDVYVKLINFMLRNLIELPAIYCQPKSDKDDSERPSENVGIILPGPDHAVHTFTMQHLRHRAWVRTMHNHNRFAVLMVMLTVFCTVHLALGALTVLPVILDYGLAPGLFITAGFCLQAIFFVLYPLVNYSYICFCVVLTVQSEHLNQYLRNLKKRCGQNRLPLKEELDLVRVWYSRVGGCVLDFDRFGNTIFFLLYFAQISAMMIKSIQVHNIFEQETFTLESYIHFIELGLLCFGTILHMQIIYSLNKSLSKPSHYIEELGMHFNLKEPFVFTEYFQFLVPRFNPKNYQLTLLRFMPIGKEFFVITSFFIISAVASYGSFGQLIQETNHQLHLLI